MKSQNEKLRNYHRSLSTYRFVQVFVFFPSPQ